MLIQAHFAAIAALDLDPIKIKLCHAESGAGWSRARADAVEVEYRRFLYLMKAFPNEHTMPSVEVDTFWHHHILDTRKYAADCAAAFGYFLHHNPVLGLDADTGAQILLRGAATTAALYQVSFGSAPEGSSAGSYCGRIVSYCGEKARYAGLVRTSTLRPLSVWDSAVPS